VVSKTAPVVLNTVCLHQLRAGAATRRRVVMGAHPGADPREVSAELEDPDERVTPREGERLDLVLVNGDVLEGRRVKAVRLRGTKVVCELSTDLGATEVVPLSCVASFSPAPKT
jgi:hypothetical protein